MAKSKKEKEDGGELNNLPNEKYQKFFKKFEEIETLDIKNWRVVHVLSYFCKKYKEVYNIDYPFKFNNPNPTKCYEVWRVNQLSSKLSSDAEILRNYIDWVFEEKAKKSKRRFSSISFITNDDVVNYYKINILLGNKKQLHLDRSSPLSTQFKDILQNFNIQMNTYGDLTFYYQVYKSGGLDETNSSNFSNALQKMKETGFDETVFERII